ncbi:MAG: hypothetical protein QOG20_5884, partial [Pseudonocardiales bacterium]|nr:hypothetical protein [Pseudonocardiales bacterium]
DRYRSSYLQDYAAQGAKYFVNYDPSLAPAGSQIAEWLATDARQVRTSAVNGCDIWSLRPGTRA